MKSRIFLILTAALLVTLVASPVQATLYSVQHLDFRAFGLNNEGHLVGARDLGGGYTNPLIWYGPTSRTVLSTFGNYSDAVAINNNDQAIISARLGHDEHGFVWTNGSYTDIGTLGGATTYAHGINDRGQVIGSSEYSLQEWGLHAFLWQDGAMQDLGTLGGRESYGSGINNNGDVVGESYTVSGSREAFLWRSGSMAALGGISSSARDINDAGQVVGSSPADGFTRTDAVLWHTSGTMQVLDGFPGSNANYALGINGSGHVVGRSGVGNGPSTAFLWANGVTTDLNSLVIGQANLGLYAAYAINDSGQILAAGSAYGSYLLTPIPEPSSLLALVGGLGGIGLLRRRSKK